MEIPVIDFSKIEGENRGEAMALLHEACKNFGFFMVMKCCLNIWKVIYSMFCKIDWTVDHTV